MFISPKVVFSFLTILLSTSFFFFFFFLPKKSLAEIATPGDWIGLFSDDEAGHSKINTATTSGSMDTTDGYSWKYAGSCSQTIGLAKLSNDDCPDCPGCPFPTPVTPGKYEFRMYANDKENAEALISKSNPFYVDITPPPVQSFAECPSQPNKTIRIFDGFFSATDQNKVQDFTADPESVLCIYGQKAAIPKSSILTYDGMLSSYFTQSKLSGTQKRTITDNNATPDNIGSPTADTLFHVTGNFTVNPPPPIQNIDVQNATVVIFVDGDLLIQNNLTHTAPGKGLVFVVKGNINITSNVTEVDAFLITFQQFCSNAVVAVPSPRCDESDDTPDLQLTIEGSVVSLNSTTHDNGQPNYSPKFVRNLLDNAQPAEEIVYQAKYLPILKDIFARPRMIWQDVTSENQLFAP